MSTSARRAACARTSRRHNRPMAIEFSERLRRIPVYPAADAYAVPEDVAMMASNESPDPPLPAVVEAVSRVLGTLNRYPDPSNNRLRKAPSDPYRGPAARTAIGHGPGGG